MIMKVTDNIELIPGVLANSYLIIEPNGLTLIDTGLPRSGKKILDYLNALGFSPEDLKVIVVTHADIDHIGGLNYLTSRGEAQVYASVIEGRAIETGIQSRELKLRGLLRYLFGIVNFFIKAKPVKVNHHLTEGDILPILGGLRVIETPGHTPGHISLFLQSQGVLFTGDSIISTSSGDLKVSSGMNTWDESQARISAEKQARLDPVIICPGHGPTVKNASEKFSEIFENS
jgi:glyoxylase-like metal-dependent hydrolase (beta-lactamase superfamily II)